MYKNKALFLAILIILFTQNIAAQNNTNSPYTRFGYGEISDNNSGEQRGMGGVGYGARSGDRINTTNPASYSSVDSLTFMFDLAASGLLSNFSDNLGQRTSFNANLEYLTLQFRLFKGVGLSAGLLPYSFAGYNFHTEESTKMPGDTVPIKYKSTFYGTGGISQVYLGLGIDLFNHVSLGANMYYMFGNYDNVKSLSFESSNYASSSETNSIKANNFRFRYGIQVYNTFREKHDVTLGVVYETKTKLKGEATQVMSTSTQDTTVISNGFEYPQMFAAGLYYTYDNKLSFGVDYSLQQWSDILFYGKKDQLRNRWKIAIGAEYQPDAKSRKYGEKMIYRVGVNMTNPYYKIGDMDPAKNFGITFGLGFPLWRSRTMVNMAMEYGKIGSYSTLNENYLKLTVNLSLAETWFVKRKL